MGLRSRRVVSQLLHRWRSALTSEERVQLMDYQHTETGPAEDESFPRLNIAPDLDGCAGPLLECRSEGEMDFGSVLGKLLYRVCVKVLNKKKLSGRVDTPWRSVLGFNDDVKPEWTHFQFSVETPDYEINQVEELESSLDADLRENGDSDAEMEAEPVFKVPTKHKKKSRSKSNKRAQKNTSQMGRRAMEAPQTEVGHSVHNQIKGEMVYTAAEISAFLKNTKGK
ncbi:hypothetical protein QTP70_034589, partial [Hemibagrus guttatus]